MFQKSVLYISAVRIIDRFLVVLILKDVVWAINHKAASASVWLPVVFHFLVDCAVGKYCLFFEALPVQFLDAEDEVSLRPVLIPWNVFFTLGEVGSKAKSSSKYSLQQCYLAENLVIMLGFSGSFGGGWVCLGGKVVFPFITFFPSPVLLPLL